MAKRDFSIFFLYLKQAKNSADVFIIPMPLLSQQGILCIHFFFLGF